MLLNSWEFPNYVFLFEKNLYSGLKRKETKPIFSGLHNLGTHTGMPVWKSFCHFKWIKKKKHSIYPASYFSILYSKCEKYLSWNRKCVLSRTKNLEIVPEGLKELSNISIFEKQLKSGSLKIAHAYYLKNLNKPWFYLILIISSIRLLTFMLSFLKKFCFSIGNF